MRKIVSQKKLLPMKTLLLLFIVFLMLSCGRSHYKGRIQVEQHSWQLKRIDTFFRAGTYKPSATWYNMHNGLYYLDNDHEFPYPYLVGTYQSNFDRK